MKRICVFCGANPGQGKLYLEAATQLGKILAKKTIGLVYGGASVGLMGAVAEAALHEGGEVIGIIPEDLVKKEVAHKGLKDLRVVKSMHERKALMEKLSDGFIALPGGFGTLEEFCEILTWAQLGLHQKPSGLLNISGYYDQFLSFLNHAHKEQFIRDGHRKMLLEGKTPEELLEKFATYKPPQVQKWIHSTSAT